MKSYYFLFAVLLLILVACSTTLNFYQLYSLKTDDNTLSLNDAIVYDDSIIRITFDFWGEGGDLDFQFYNKTDENLIVNLDSTFFIKNFHAYPYYNSKSTQNSYLQSYSADYTKISPKKSLLTESTSNSASQSFSVTRYEERQLIIPPKSYRYVRCDLPISYEYISNKGQIKYPDEDEIKQVTFSKYDTPILFRIRVSYQNNLKSICNAKDFEFYISEITNYPDYMFFEEYGKYAYGDYYQSAYTYKKIKFKYLSSNRFYNFYHKK